MAQSSKTSKQTGQAGRNQVSGQLLYDLLEKILKEQERILTQQESQLGESRYQEQRLFCNVDTPSKELKEPVAEVQSLKASLRLLGGRSHGGFHAEMAQPGTKYCSVYMT